MTSEPKPIGKNKQAPNAGRKSDIQASNTKPNVPPAPSVPTFPPTKSQSEITCKTEKNWWDRFKPFVEIFGIVLLGIYTVFTIKIWRATNIASQAATDSLKATSKQFQLDRRPYVVVSKYQMLDFTTKKASGPIKGTPLLVNLLISNVGKSPALNVIIHRHLLFREYIFKQLKANAPDIGKSDDFIAQGQEVVVTAVSIKDTFANETQDISTSELLQWDGTTPIIVFGRITYQDDFGESYCTPFLSRYFSPTMWQRESAVMVSSRNFAFITRDLCPAGKIF